MLCHEPGLTPPDLLPEINEAMEFVKDSYLQEPKHRGKYILYQEITEELLTSLELEDFYSGWVDSKLGWYARSLEHVMNYSIDNEDQQDTASLQDQILKERADMIIDHLVENSGIPPEEEEFQLPQHCVTQREIWSLRQRYRNLAAYYTLRGMKPPTRESLNIK